MDISFGISIADIVKYAMKLYRYVKEQPPNNKNAKRIYDKIPTMKDLINFDNDKVVEVLSLPYDIETKSAKLECLDNIDDIMNDDRLLHYINEYIDVIIEYLNDKLKSSNTQLEMNFHSGELSCFWKIK